MNSNGAGVYRINHRVAWRYWKRRVLDQITLTPLRITIVYTAIGLVGLVVSDVLLVWYVADPLLSQVQAIKGGVEVVLTAGLVFALTSRRETQHQRSVRRLDRQREELQVLHRVLRHNLRNDLTVILGQAEWLRRNPASADGEHAAKIVRTGENVLRYVDQAARIKEVSESSEERQRYDLREQIDQLLDEHPATSSEVSVSKTVPERALIEANPMITEALAELLDNAIEHNDADAPTVAFEVHPEKGPFHMVEIHVVDNGPGIPEFALEPLRAGKEEQLLHLDGMGLWFVEWTVRHSEGKLRFENGDRRGTTVVLQVPKAPSTLPTPTFTLADR